jgi:hypothetical protein
MRQLPAYSGTERRLGRRQTRMRRYPSPPYPPTPVPPDSDRRFHLGCWVPLFPYPDRPALHKKNLKRFQPSNASKALKLATVRLLSMKG